MSARSDSAADVFAHALHWLIAPKDSIIDFASAKFQITE
jgi:hypothetical protein